jgi:hypothetical protein
MRRILIGTAALALAAPAGAQVVSPEDKDLVRAVPPPEQIEATADAVHRVVGAVLDMPIGPLVDAIDAADPDRRRARRYPRERTVGEMASRDDPYFEERLHDTIEGAAASADVIAAEVAVVAPEMRRAIGRIERDVDRAVDDARARREKARGRR